MNNSTEVYIIIITIIFRNKFFSKVTKNILYVPFLFEIPFLFPKLKDERNVGPFRIDLRHDVYGLFRQLTLKI